MKKFIIFPLLLSLFNTVQATTYYLSSSQGHDMYDGLSEATPWQTLDKLKTLKLPNQVTLLFKRQDVFRGTLSTIQFPLGTTLGAYGQGDNPILSGSVLITHWKSTTHPALSPQVYEADLSDQNVQNLQHLFVNGKLMTIARYPNVPDPEAKNWLKVGASAGQDAFTDPVLAAYKKPNNYWKGATLRIRTYSWMYNVLPVTGYEASSGKIIATGLDDQVPIGNQVLPEWGYFLDGKLEELDFPGEWFYDSISKKVYLYPPDNVDPNQAQVEGSIQSGALNFNMSVRDVTIEHLTFRHFTKAIYVGAAKNVIIRQCRFEQNGSGIRIWNTDPIMIENNIFDHQFSDTIALGGDSSSDPNHSIVQNNWITHTGAYRVYGERTQGAYQGIGIKIGGRAHTVRQNTIEYSSHAGLYIEGVGGHLIEHNIVRHSLQLLNDGGGVVVATSNNVLRGNFVLNSLGNTDESNGCSKASTTPPCSHHSSYGMGIGSNAGAGLKENIIEENTVAYNPHNGIRLNGFNHSIVRNNVLYNNGTQLHIEDVEGKPGSSSENVIEHNIVYALSPGQRGLKLKSTVETTPHGRFDYNYYCNPSSEVALTDNLDRKYSLAHWQQDFPTQEQHSRNCSWKFKTHQVLSSGQHLIKNSLFDGNIAPWRGGSYDATQSQLDGGSLKLVFPEKNNFGFLVYGDLALQENQFYRMRLSVVGNGFGNIEWTMTDPDNTEAMVQFKQLLSYDVSRKEYDEIFQFPRTTSRGQLFLMMRSFDASPFWVDNVSLEPVEVMAEDPTKQSVLFSNITDKAMTFDLGTIKYLDLDGNEVLSSLTLPPFTSQILVAVGTTVVHPVLLTIVKSGNGSGTITSSIGLGNGIDCGGICSETFTPESLVTLNIMPSEDSLFAGWNEEMCTQPFTITQDLICTANFSLIPPKLITLTVIKAGNGSGIVTSSVGLGDGIHCGDVCSELFVVGKPVTLNAIPSEGSVFSGWNDVRCENPFTITEDLTCTANFSLIPPKPVTLTIVKAGKGSGTITSSVGLGQGIDCGEVCSETFIPGSFVTLDVLPNEGSLFSGWNNEQCATPFTITEDSICTAYFSLVPPKPVTLTITKVGDGLGTITSSVGLGQGIDCGEVCSETFTPGSLVTLDILPNEGSLFSGWNNEQCATPFTITEDSICTAHFSLAPPKPVTLTITKVGDGLGTITSSVGLGQGIDCGEVCSETFTPGSLVTLEVKPEEGSLFSRWSDIQCASPFTLTENMTCTAHFSLVPPPKPVTLNIMKTGNGSGTVISSAGLGDGIHCGKVCKETFTPGTLVTLSVVPDEGSLFSGWNDMHCADPFTITENLVCKAQFSLVPPPPVTLNIIKVGNGLGTVISSAGLGNGIDCGEVCSEMFTLGSPVTLNAEPNEGSIFSGWNDAYCANPFIIKENLMCTAHFSLAPPITTHTLKILKVGTVHGGTVTSETPNLGIHCGSTCHADYPEGTVVTLHATFHEGYEFIGWNGQCSGTEPSLTIILDEDKTCTAGFNSLKDVPTTQPIDVPPSRD